MLALGRWVPALPRVLTHQPTSSLQRMRSSQISRPGPCFLEVCHWLEPVCFVFVLLICLAVSTTLNTLDGCEDEERFVEDYFELLHILGAVCADQRTLKLSQFCIGV